MPTVRSRFHRHLLPQLSETMLCFLLNQELPKVIGDRDLWWLTVERGARDPDEAWWPRSARALWAQHQDQLRPAWRALNGDLPYPIDTDPISWPGIAEASARERHEEELERRRRVVVPGQETNIRGSGSLSVAVRPTPRRLRATKEAGPWGSHHPGARCVEST